MNIMKKLATMKKQETDHKGAGGYENEEDFKFIFIINDVFNINECHKE